MSSAVRKMMRAQARANAKHQHQLLREAMASGQKAEAMFCRAMIQAPLWARLLMAFRIVFKRFNES